MEPSEYKPFAPEVHDYVDGRLSAEGEQTFERSMQLNPELKRQVEALERSIALLGSIPVVEPKPGFNDRVIGRIREEELADRARKRISGAPMPLWQHVVHVGLGAAAAALVLAVIGVPGMFSDETDLNGTGGPTAYRVAPSEEDLLPALADHNARFESLRRNVAHTRLADPHLQRQVIALELEYSDLTRRNQWLSAQVAELPASQRARYQEFLADIDLAIGAINNEVLECLRSGRDLNSTLVNAQLAKVRAPGPAVDNYVLSAGPVARRDVERMADAPKTEIMLYAEMRQADYRHDHLSVIKAADAYLENFGQGYFKDQAHAAVVAAYLRLGNDRLAAEEFVARFGKYDEDLQPGQLELVRGLLTSPEIERLTASRRALSD